MDAIVFLETEHLGAKKAMEQISNSPTLKKKQLFLALKMELEMHDKLEETIFYPAVLANPKTKGFPGIDKQAHLAVEQALDKLTIMPADDAAWTHNFDSMRKALLQHVADEETHLFVKIRESLDQAELNAIGDKMKTEKERQLKAV